MRLELEFKITHVDEQVIRIDPIVEQIHFYCYRVMSVYPRIKNCREFRLPTYPSRPRRNPRAAGGGCSSTVISRSSLVLSTPQ